MISPDLRFSLSKLSSCQPGAKEACTASAYSQPSSPGQNTSRDVCFQTGDRQHLTTYPLVHSKNKRSDRRAPGANGSAICVQRLDDSLNSAIHTTYRSLLRSSSMHEPRGPPLEVVNFFQVKTPQHKSKRLVTKKKDIGAREARRGAPL